MRILLVEDEVRLARSYARNLGDDGHTVTTSMMVIWHMTPSWPPRCLRRADCGCAIAGSQWHRALP